MCWMVEDDFISWLMASLLASDHESPLVAHTENAKRRDIDYVGPSSLRLVANARLPFVMSSSAASVLERAKGLKRRLRISL